ncbi:stimulated by retinoic acid gene 6 protein-like, partial [Saccoglossus kowalevskii]
MSVCYIVTRAGFYSVHMCNVTYASEIQVSGSRYIGFQVAYMAWGFIIQSVLLFVFIWIFVFFLSESQGREYLVQGLGYIGPLVVVGILVTVIQYVMARFVFLQDKGQSFALDNRRLFHNFTYFMFFYNAFLGVFSCLMRILKAMIIGAFVLSRIDQSTLPRKYEIFDP